MQHISCRCKHCGKSYSYCTYGNGPQFGTEEGCSMEYCGECQTAINDALSKIPVKFRPTLVPVTDEKTKEFLDTLFKQEKEKFYSGSLPIVAKLVGDYGYETVEECTFQWVRYIRGVKTDGSVEYKVEKEYDVSKKEITQKLYTDDRRNKKQSYMPCKQYRLPKKENFSVEIKPLTPPTGEIFFNSPKL